MHSLDKDSKILILSCLCLRDCFSFARACKSFFSLIESPAFWKARLKKDFSHASIKALDYKRYYMQLYIEECERNIYVQKLKHKLAKKNFSTIKYLVKCQLGHYLPVYPYRYYKLIIPGIDNLDIHDSVTALDGRSVPEVEYFLKKKANFVQDQHLYPRDILTLVYGKYVYWLFVFNMSTVSLHWKNNGEKLYDIIAKAYQLNYREISNYNIPYDDLYR